MPLVIGTLVSTVSLAMYALFHDTTWELMLGSAVFGLGIGFGLSSMANLIVEHVDEHEVGIATGINTIARTVGGALGSQVIASIVNAHHQAGTDFPKESGYTTAFAFAAVASLVAAACAWRARGGHDEDAPGNEPVSERGLEHA